MTPDDFKQKYRHPLCGLLADAAVVSRRSGELSLFLQDSFAKVDRLLEQMVVDLADVKPATKPRVADAGKNGVAESPTRKVQ